MMIGNILHLHRAEGSKSHMKGHPGNPNPLCLNRIKKLFGKMQTGCRRCCLRVLHRPSDTGFYPEAYA